MIYEKPSIYNGPTLYNGVGGIYNGRGVYKDGAGASEYIEDDFICLYNGLDNSGLLINYGSLGTVYRDSNGPIISPDGLGMPYYDRDKFTASDGGAQAVYNEFKNVFKDKIFTIDFWFYYNNNVVLENAYVIGMYNNDRSVNIFEFTMKDASHYYVGQSSNKYSMPITTQTWTHVAFVCNDTLAYVFKNGVLESTLDYSGISKYNNINRLRFRKTNYNNGGIRISQFAIRDYPVWTSNFDVPTKLYKQK